MNDAWWEAELAALLARAKAQQQPEPSVLVAQQRDSLQGLLDNLVDVDVIDLNGQAFTIPTLNIRRKIEIRNGTLLAQPNLNDLVTIADCEGVVLRGLVLRGDGTTRRGIAANGRNMLFEVVYVEHICRPGTESQAVAIWNGTGLTIRDSFLEGASQSFLSGGAAPTVPNHIPSDILLENCTLTRDTAWRGAGMAVKTGFELKSARLVTVRNCVIENVWVDAQTGWAITLTPSQYGNSPETVVEDVLFTGNVIRNVAGGANILGFTQHTEPTRATQRANNLRFIANTFAISRATNGGHGALMQLGIEPAELVWKNNDITQDGDFLRTTDKRPILGFRFNGNSVNTTGTYGVFTPLGSRGVGFAAAFPDGLIADNTFYSAHSTFKTNFPNNVWK